MSHQAAKTGSGPMVMVALEQHFPEHERIIHDELARRILPLSMRASIWLKLRLMSVDKMVKWSENKMPGMWSGFMCRKRYIDDKLVEALHGQVDVVVNLGAGFDTRAYQIPALSDVDVWEVDQPENITAKRKRLTKIYGVIPKHITLVPIDFDKQDLDDVMQANGYSNDIKTFFIWEAVTQYLPEESVRETFDYLSRAASGSRLTFTYIRKDFINGKALYGHDYLYKNMIQKQHSWQFGVNPDDVADLLGAYQWRVLEHLGYDELAERYVKPTGRKLLTTPLERIVYAEKI